MICFPSRGQWNIIKFFATGGRLAAGIFLNARHCGAVWTAEYVRTSFCHIPQFIFMPQVNNDGTFPSVLESPGSAVHVDCYNTKITSDHLYNLFSTCKAPSIISFPFQNPPKAFHGAVVKTFGNSRHTLRHTCFFQLVVKHSACILKSSVTMK